jgi:hypothetical protein
MRIALFDLVHQGILSQQDHLDASLKQGGHHIAL